MHSVAIIVCLTSVIVLPVCNGLDCLNGPLPADQTIINKTCPGGADAICTVAQLIGEEDGNEKSLYFHACSTRSKCDGTCTTAAAALVQLTSLVINVNFKQHCCIPTCCQVDLCNVASPSSSCPSTKASSNGPNTTTTTTMQGTTPDSTTTTTTAPTMHESKTSAPTMHESKTTAPTMHESKTTAPTMHESKTTAPTMHESKTTVSATKDDSTTNKFKGNDGNSLLISKLVLLLFTLISCASFAVVLV